MLQGIIFGLASPLVVGIFTGCTLPKVKSLLSLAVNNVLSTAHAGVTKFSIYNGHSKR